jgi:IS66 Orf2 like protein/Transposase IS66 family
VIPVSSGVRVWLAVGHTDMRRGMNSLAIQVQQVLGRDPHAGDRYALSPLRELIRRHVFDADRVHGDETTVPVLAPGKTGTERLST